MQNTKNLKRKEDVVARAYLGKGEGLFLKSVSKAGDGSREPLVRKDMAGSKPVRKDMAGSKPEQP